MIQLMYFQNDLLGQYPRFAWFVILRHYKLNGNPTHPKNFHHTKSNYLNEIFQTPCYFRFILLQRNCIQQYSKSTYLSENKNILNKREGHNSDASKQHQNQTGDAQIKRKRILGNP